VWYLHSVTQQLIITQLGEGAAGDLHTRILLYSQISFPPTLSVHTGVLYNWIRRRLLNIVP
jgi:hypothetical protein